MTSLVASPGSIPRNIFEKYYEILEQQRLRYDQDTEFVLSIDYLERLVLAIEHSVQDYTSNESMSKGGRDKLFFITTTLLNNWLSLVICCEGEKMYLDALTYNLIPVLSSLENIQIVKIIDTLRHISKFNPVLDFFKSRPLISKRIEMIIKELGISQDNAIDTTRFIKLLYSEYNKNTLVTTIDELNAFLLEDEGNKYYFKQIVLSEFSFEMLDRFVLDRLKMKGLFEQLKTEGPAEIRKATKEKDLFEIIERLFEFDDSTHDLIWLVQVRVTGQKFNAAQLGYLIWSFSKSLESIDDIEVELLEWGEGSKWFNLRVRIKSLASKVDLADLFKELRQMLESFYHKKPIDEIRKIEAEKEKIIAETKMISKEEASLMSDEQLRLKNQFLLQKEFLEIEARKIANESMRIDLQLKNLEYLKGLSELMKDGIIQNTTDIQIVINDLIFFKKEKGEITLGDHELLDLNERTERKIGDDNIPQ